MQTIKVLDDGFVRLVDTMGDDSSIVQAARVSYGEGTKTVHDDRGLIRYLMRHHHTTPFEMCEIKLHVRVPMDTWRQWIRHRTASVNEYSTRYSEAIDSCQKTTEWRAQSASNKQGSSGMVEEWPEGYEVKKAATLPIGTEFVVTGNGQQHPVGFLYREPPTSGQYLSDREALLHKVAREVYEERLQFGVAREQARKDLPLSNYTEAYWKIDLKNLLHFLQLRMDSHAQYEIRQYANAIASIVEQWVPLTWEAFVQYRMNAITLSSLEIKYIQHLVTGCCLAEACKKMSGRELEEMKVKLNFLGIEFNEQNT